MSFADSVRALIEDGAVTGGFLLAAVLVLVGTPLAMRLAPLIGGVDSGGDRPRIHKAPVPRIGGLAIVVAIIVPALLLVGTDGAYGGILLATAAVAGLGLIDDTVGLRPSVKLAAVTTVAIGLVAGWDLTIDRFTLPVLGDHELGWAGYPLAVVWIAFLTNLVNLIDGMDGLAAGIVAIAAAALALLAASFERADPAAVAAIICGATLAFLYFNYHPAKVFMGDSGALALGFILAAISIEGVSKTAATIALAGPLLVVGVPILDTSFVVLKRLKYRRAPWGADHNHFYHRFLRIGFSQRRTAAYLHLWAAGLAAGAIVIRFVPPRPGGVWDLGNSLVVAGVGLVAFAASVWMVYTLEILKARHLRAIGLGRVVDRLDLREDIPPETDAERDEAVEQALVGPSG